MKSGVTKISYGELPEYLVEKITGLVHSHTTILIRVPKTTTQIDHISQMGSGTFVRVGDNFGILTATHVTNLIETGDSLGLFLLPEGREHNFFLSPSEYKVFRIGRFLESDEDSAEDLSFVLIAKERTGTINAYKSFMNLDKQEEYSKELINDLESNDFQRGIWFFTGVPAEKTKPGTPTKKTFSAVNEYLLFSSLGPPERFQPKVNGILLTSRHSLVSLKCQPGPDNIMEVAVEAYGGYLLTTGILHPLSISLQVSLQMNIGKARTRIWFAATDHVHCFALGFSS